VLKRVTEENQETDGGWVKQERISELEEDHEQPSVDSAKQSNYEEATSPERERASPLLREKASPISKRRTLHGNTQRHSSKKEISLVSEEESSDFSDKD